jgi:hypothetical protein
VLAGERTGGARAVAPRPRDHSCGGRLARIADHGDRDGAGRTRRRPSWPAPCWPW